MLSKWHPLSLEMWPSGMEYLQVPKLGTNRFATLVKWYHGGRAAPPALVFPQGSKTF